MMLEELSPLRTDRLMSEDGIDYNETNRLSSDKGSHPQIMLKNQSQHLTMKLKTEKLNHNPHAMEVLRGSFSTEELNHYSLGKLERELDLNS